MKKKSYLRNIVDHLLVSVHLLLQLFLELREALVDH